MDQDYIFSSEKPGAVKGAQFTEASLSTIFRRITEHLKMQKGAPFGKPGHYRLHGLRKYFRNNCRAEEGFREFWMGHSLGVDAHYISRDPEEHRKRYAEAYEGLRILAPVTPGQLKDINDQLRKKDQEIAELQAKVGQIQNSANLLAVLKVLGSEDAATLIKNYEKKILKKEKIVEGQNSKKHD